MIWHLFSSSFSIVSLIAACVDASRYFIHVFFIQWAFKQIAAVLSNSFMEGNPFVLILLITKKKPQRSKHTHTQRKNINCDCFDHLTSLTLRVWLWLLLLFAHCHSPCNDSKMIKYQCQTQFLHNQSQSNVKNNIFVDIVENLSKLFLFLYVFLPMHSHIHKVGPS